jgi:hypothetical protein
MASFRQVSALLNTLVQIQPQPCGISRKTRLTPFKLSAVKLLPKLSLIAFGIFVIVLTRRYLDKDGMNGPGILRPHSRGCVSA